MVYELPSQTALAAILVDRLDYSTQVAKTTARDLLSMQDRDLRVALAGWVDDQALQCHIEELGVTTDSLVASGLTYPAALIMIDWIRESPEVALGVLNQRM